MDDKDNDLAVHQNCKNFMLPFKGWGCNIQDVGNFSHSPDITVASVLKKFFSFVINFMDVHVFGTVAEISFSS